MLKDCWYYFRYSRHIKNLKKEYDTDAGSKKAKGKMSYRVFQRAVVFVAVLMWLVSLIQVINDNSRKDNNGIISAFNNNMYSDISSQAYIYGKYSDAYVDEVSQEIILIKIAEDIGINRYSIENSSESSENIKTLSQTSSNGDVVIKFISPKDSILGEKKEQYIYIGVTIKNNINSLPTYEERIRDIAKKMNISGNVYVSMTGTVNGDLSDEEKRKYSDNILDVIGAKYVTGKRGTDIYTLYAYDKGIDDYIKIGRDRINVNLTMNYDETEDKTCINLATPVYNYDY